MAGDGLTGRARGGECLADEAGERDFDCGRRARRSGGSLSGVFADEGLERGRLSESGEECLDCIVGGADSRLVLLDIWLPGIDGMETWSRIQRDAGGRSADGGDDFRATGRSRRQ